MDQKKLSENHQEEVASLTAVLRDRFSANYQLTSVEQKERVRELLSTIGRIDWTEEGYTSPDRQRDLTMKFHWGHNHDFDQGLSIRGRMGDRHLALIAEFIVGFGLSEDFLLDKEILDVGCWTGGTSLALYLFKPKSINAIEEVQKYARAANFLFKDVFRLMDVSCEGGSLYHLNSGEYDCVYVPGVVYHLSDPVIGLRILYNRLRDGGWILVESQGLDDSRCIAEFSGGGASPGGDASKLDREGWNWFLPSPSCLGAWLEAAGFSDVSVFHSLPKSEGKVFGMAKRVGFQEITRAGLSSPHIS